MSIFCITITSANGIDTQKYPASAVSINISLPSPVHSSDNALENALEKRRSTRVFDTKPLSTADLSLLLWAGQGITNKTTGQRTAPSAMRTYPLTLHVVVNNVSGVNPGVYAFDPVANILKPELNESGMSSVVNAMSGKGPAASAPAPVIVTIEANYSPFLKVQGTEEEAIRHASLEAGHVAQNILLMETSKGMAGTPFTGFNTSDVEKALNITGDNHVIYAISGGYPLE